MPGKIIHDQGREFESKLFQQLSRSCNIKRLRTTPYHSQCNGQVERMNQSIISMLITLESTEKRSWKNHINKLVHAYNCTKSSSTEYAPYFLLFGQKPRMSIDLILSPTDDANEDYSHSKFVEDWKTQMSEAYHEALQNSSHRKEKDIARHEMIKKLSLVLEQGDRVLIRNTSERGGTGKMRSFWEEKVHVVVENINNENTTYKVTTERGTDGRIRVLHKNMLLPCDNLLDNFS